MRLCLSMTIFSCNQLQPMYKHLACHPLKENGADHITCSTEYKLCSDLNGLCITIAGYMCVRLRLLTSIPSRLISACRIRMA